MNDGSIEDCCCPEKVKIIIFLAERLNKCVFDLYGEFRCFQHIPYQEAFPDEVC